MFSVIDQCRICGNRRLESILNLGDQFLTGVFPKNHSQTITCGPLELVKCHGDSRDTCGMVQLRQTYNLVEMYGQDYGYRSSLNRSMVEHLRAKVESLMRRVSLRPGDLVLDIGSNDGTLLSFYPADGLTRVGIDPTAEKFQSFYQPDIQRVADFFSARTFRKWFGDRKAKIVAAIAMFYDLENPLAFMREVSEILAPDGIWHFEQSYLPSMLECNAYDTICHEHCEYYALQQIQWMVRQTDLKIIDVEVNPVNGGSFSVTVAKANSAYRENTSAIESLGRREEAAGINSLPCYERFVKMVFQHKEKLLALLERIRAGRETVLGYGASTKGNVILQFCGIDTGLLPAIADVNEDKFGCWTPGTKIPIISEAEAHRLKPDYFLVLPWHFRLNLVQREAGYLKAGGRMIFPLPEIQIVAQ